jgi:hypothetical protein
MVSTFTQKFREYLEHKNIFDCVELIISDYFNQNKSDNNDYCTLKYNITTEKYELMLEWIDDYVGNIDLNESETFINKCGSCKISFVFNNIIQSDYNNKISYNRKIIARIIKDYIVLHYIL